MALAVLAGCSAEYLDDFSSKAEMSSVDGAYAPESGGSGPAAQSGLVTAGEWNDLDNWPFWGKLMSTTQDEQTVGYGQYSGEWQFWTGRRVALSVKSGDGKPAPGVKVSLLSGNTPVWKAVTDVLGRADCWIGIHDEKFQEGTLAIELNGTRMEGEPSVTGWNDETVAMNVYTISAAAPEAAADILFIVDATGSMGDELEFLKADLTDILGKASQLQIPVSIRTGALFYRDEGDEYITRESSFSKDFSKTVNFIKKQNAGGGGDYPEAVHTALQTSLQAFDWNTSARARIAFMLLDAPPHEDVQGVMDSIHSSIDSYASMGIKLIPVASSGIDKPTEFLLRMMAIATGGTYVFITGDSGIGGEHLIPTVGEYQVELLNDLMVRLIQKYLE